MFRVLESMHAGTCISRRGGSSGRKQVNKQTASCNRHNLDSGRWTPTKRVIDFRKPGNDSQDRCTNRVRGEFLRGNNPGLWDIDLDDPEQAGG